MQQWGDFSLFQRWKKKNLGVEKLLLRKNVEKLKQTRLLLSNSTALCDCFMLEGTQVWSEYEIVIFECDFGGNSNSNMVWRRVMFFICCLFTLVTVGFLWVELLPSVKRNEMNNYDWEWGSWLIFTLVTFTRDMKHSTKCFGDTL